MLEGLLNYTHRPWANTFKCYPELYLQPCSVENVQSIVHYAYQRGTNVVVTGSTHSPSIITKTSGMLVNLDDLNRIIDCKEEPGGKYTDVTVEAGIRLYVLNEELASRGLALQNLGSISDQSVAGVISTGTHGSSCYHGLISEQIVSLDLVTETGKVVTVSERINRDLFEAVLLGLGAFGIIVRATIRTVPAFNLESRSYVVGFDELLRPDMWGKVFIEAEFHRIWWYPYANKCLVWQADRTDKPEGPPLYSFYGTRAGYLLFEFFLWIAVCFMPQWTPHVECWLFERQFNSKKITTHVGRSDKQINMDCLFKQFVNEWSVPLSNGTQVLHELRDSILEKHWFVHSPIELRASNTTLPSSTSISYSVGPVYGNTTRPILDPSPMLNHVPPAATTNDSLTLNINATMFRPFGCNPPVKRWYDSFESTCNKYGGRPHWAKIFSFNPWLQSDVNLAAINKWKKIRDTWATKRLFGGTKWLEEKGLN